MKASGEVGENFLLVKISGYTAIYSEQYKFISPSIASFDLLYDLDIFMKQKCSLELDFVSHWEWES